MKIICYQVDSQVPFKELYQPLNSWERIFFSNQKDFDEGAIKPLLPSGTTLIRRAEEENTVWLVPVQWKEALLPFLRKQFAIPGLQWEVALIFQKPSKGEIGIDETGSLSEFYEQLTVSEVFVSGYTVIPPDETCVERLSKGIPSLFKGVGELFTVVPPNVIFVGVGVIVVLILLLPPTPATLEKEWKNNGYTAAKAKELIEKYKDKAAAIGVASKEIEMVQRTSQMQTPLPLPPPKDGNAGTVARQCYKVKQGDTIVKIASTYCGKFDPKTMSDIARASNMGNLDKLSKGTLLKLPCLIPAKKDNRIEDCP